MTMIDTSIASGLRALFVCSLTLGSLAAAGGSNLDVIDETKGKTTDTNHYLFQRGGVCPGYPTVLMVARNLEAKHKLRPFFLVGHNRSGSVKTTFPTNRDMQRIGRGDQELAKLMDYGQVVGKFETELGLWSGGTDLERQVGATWFEQRAETGSFPKVEIAIDSIGALIFVDEKKSKGVVGGASKTFRAPLTGRIIIDGREVHFKRLAQIHLADPTSGTGRSAKASMRITVPPPPPRKRKNRKATKIEPFIIKGSELGWTGDDAGDIQLQLHFRGTADLKENTKQIFDEVFDDLQLNEDLAGDDEPDLDDALEP